MTPGLLLLLVACQRGAPDDEARDAQALCDALSGCLERACGPEESARVLGAVSLSTPEAQAVRERLSRGLTRAAMGELRELVLDAGARHSPECGHVLALSGD